MKKLLPLIVFCLLLTASLAEAQPRRGGQTAPQSTAREAKLAVIAPELAMVPGGGSSGSAGEALVKSSPAVPKADEPLTHPRNHVLLVGVNIYAPIEPLFGVNLQQIHR